MKCGSTEVFKIITAALAAALLSGAGAWVAFGRDTVTREELRNLSPWTIERGEITAGIRENTRNISRLEAITAKILESQNQMAVDQQAIITKLEALIRQRR